MRLLVSAFARCLRAVSLCSHPRSCRSIPVELDRRLPLSGQVLEGVSVEQHLLEIAALMIAHVAEWRVGDDLLDAAAQQGARHWQSLRRRGYWFGDVTGEHRADLKYSDLGVAPAPR
jgi:hypothetical protein